MCNGDIHTNLKEIWYEVRDYFLFKILNLYQAVLNMAMTFPVRRIKVEEFLNRCASIRFRRRILLHLVCLTYPPFMSYCFMRFSRVLYRYISISSTFLCFLDEKCVVCSAVVWASLTSSFIAFHMNIKSLSWFSVSFISISVLDVTIWQHRII